MGKKLLLVTPVGYLQLGQGWKVYKDQCIID